MPMLWRSACLVPQSFQCSASSYRCCLCWEVPWGKRRSFTTSTAVTWTLTCSLRCERIWEAGLGLLGFRDGKARPVSWGGKVGTRLKAGLGAAEELRSVEKVRVREGLRTWSLKTAVGKCRQVPSFTFFKAFCFSEQSFEGLLVLFYRYSNQVSVKPSCS